jgi:hypothetical protein
MSGFEVRHYNNGGTLLGSVYPTRLSWGDSLSSIGYVSYDIPLDHPLADSQRTWPYMTDFQVYWQDTWFMMGGMITEFEIDDELEVPVVHVGGKDWAHYYERIIWPKDPNSNYRTTTAADPTNGTVFDYTDNRKYIVYILSEQSEYPPYNADLFMASASSGGTTIRKTIYPGDTQSIYEHMMEVLRTGSGISGYDFFRFNANKIANWYTYGGSLPTLKYRFEHKKNCIVRVGHHGILGTRTFGIAQGPSSRRGFYYDHSYQATYRRYDVVEEFSQQNAYATVQDLTNAAAQENAREQVVFTIKLNPGVSDVFPYVFENVPVGSYVKVTADIGAQWNASVDCVVVSREFEQDEFQADSCTLTCLPWAARF